MTTKAAVILAMVLTAAPAAAQSALSDGNDLLCTRWGCAGGALRGEVSSWRANPEGDYQNNDGAALALEAAAPLPFLADYGLGVQGSLSQGTYDLSGRDSKAPNNPQTQQFVSFGLFRRPNPTGNRLERWGAGLVYDTMYNKNAGTQSNTFLIRQVRGKVSYDVSGGHEVGLWFAAYHGTALTGMNEYFASTPNAYRGVDQLNFFYKYDLAHGGDLSAYFGPGVGGQSIAPDSSNLLKPDQSRVFTFTVGANATVPICDYAAFTGGFSYGRPNSMTNGIMTDSNIFEAFSVSVGLKAYFGGNARVREDAGRHWMPYVPAPDNGSFVTQSNTAN